MYRDPFRGIGFDQDQLNHVMGRVPLHYHYYHFRPFGMAVDVDNMDAAVRVTLSAPGLRSSEDIEVWVADNVVYVKAKTEKIPGGFTKAVPLPADVDGEKARVGHKEGIFTIDIPKRTH